MKEKRINEFMQSVITDFENSGRYSTAHVYHCAMKAAVSYGGTDLCFEDITVGWLVLYQDYLLAQQLLWNTISTYMRMLRAVYNRAVDLGIAPFVPRLFKGVFTGREVNHRRALKGKEMKRILCKEEDEGTVIEEAVADKKVGDETDTEPVNASLSRKDLRWARACLELMLRFHGMPFVDLVHLRKSDLRDGYIVTRRRKSGIQLTVAVTPEAMALLRRYASIDPDSPFLLGFLDWRLSGRESYNDYQRLLRLLNLRLRQLARKCGLGRGVTSYSARHTWATVAKYCGIPLGVISEALGHTSVTTTEGYLKQFEGDVLEKADKVIIEYIFNR